MKPLAVPHPHFQRLEVA